MSHIGHLVRVLSRKTTLVSVPPEHEITRSTAHLWEENRCGAAAGLMRRFGAEPHAPIHTLKPAPPSSVTVLVDHAATSARWETLAANNAAAT
jgi:hypothetical protein